MKVTCKRCSKEYNLDPTKIRSDSAKVRCTHCGYVFTVNKDGSCFYPEDSQGIDKSNSATYRVRLKNGLTYGFNDSAMLKNWFKEKKISPSDELSYMGGPWKKINEYPEYKSWMSPEAKVQEPTDITDKYKPSDLGHEPKFNDDSTKNEDILSQKTNVSDKDGLGPEESISFEPSPSRLTKDFEPQKQPSIQSDRFEMPKEFHTEETRGGKIPPKKKDSKKIMQIIRLSLIIILFFVGFFFMFQNNIIKFVKDLKGSATPQKEQPLQEQPTNIISPEEQKVVTLVFYGKYNAPELSEEILSLEPRLNGIRAENLFMLGKKKNDIKLKEQARDLATQIAAMGEDTEFNKVAALRTLYLYYLEMGDSGTALKYLSAAANMAPSDSYTLTYTGLYYKDSGFALKAKTNFAKAIEIDKENVIARRELLEFAKTENNQEEVEIHKLSLETIESNLFIAFPKLQREEVVEEPPKKEVIKEKPKVEPKKEPAPPKEEPVQVEKPQAPKVSDSKSAKEHFAKGSYFYTKGNYAQARREYELAVKVSPKNTTYRYRLGVTYQDLFESENAIKEFKKVLELDSNFYQAYKNLGVLYAQLGENAQAKTYLNRYLSLNPNADDSAEIRRLLQELP